MRGVDPAHRALVAIMRDQDEIPPPVGRFRAQPRDFVGKQRADQAPGVENAGHAPCIEAVPAQELQRDGAARGEHMQLARGRLQNRPAAVQQRCERRHGFQHNQRRHITDVVGFGSGIRPLICAERGVANEMKPPVHLHRCRATADLAVAVLITGRIPVMPESGTAANVLRIGHVGAKDHQRSEAVDHIHRIAMAKEHPVLLDLLPRTATDKLAGRPGWPQRHRIDLHKTDPVRRWYGTGVEMQIQPPL